MTELRVARGIHRLGVGLRELVEVDGMIEASDVRTVMVDGRIVVADGALATADDGEIRRRVRALSIDIGSLRGGTTA